MRVKNLDGSSQVEEPDLSETERPSHESRFGITHDGWLNFCISTRNVASGVTPTCRAAI
jgi:hypothetical protein